MPFDAVQILLIVIAILISSVVQAAIGFAVALIAIPLLLNAGLSLPESIFVVLTTAMIQNVWGLKRTWNEIEVHSLVIPAFVRLIAIPPGFLLMQSFENLGRDRLRQIFGIILLVILILQFVIRLKPRARVPAGWTLAAMVTSGVAQGGIGTPGPPIAFWTMAHDWNSGRARGTLFFLFLTGSIPHLLLFAATTRPETLAFSATISIACLPLAILGSAIGLWLGARFDRSRLRRLTFLTLILLSMKLIFLP